ncbi:MAG: DUF4838 domain-containing protein [Prosthecobacter sp.]|uniref:DUF4838 domain-containing protein n=1 Tax=Prosthecobacter sp. TaxID=1965333 RepID=UPI003900E65D
MTRFILLLATTTAFAEERVLIENGSSSYEIVHSADANAATTLAARELSTWVKQSTGVLLPVVTVASPERPHIFVAADMSLKPEGYRLKTVGADIHITGADVQRGSLVPKRVSGTQTGSLSGVYDLLERCMGIQFLWHDKLGTIVPKHARVTVPDLDIDTAPAWTYRFLAYSPEGKCGDDMFARRLRLGHSHTVAHSHSWHQIMPVETYGKAHPEWFAEIDGKRKPEYYLEHHGGQVCTTNTEVIEVFAQAAIDFFNAHPDRDMFSLSPNDGSGFCTCAKCKALDHGASLTDRLITFYNAIAERVAKVQPTKLLGAYAYSFYREPPVKVKPHPQVYVVHATNTAFHQGVGWPAEHVMEQQWRAMTKRFAKYDIYYSPDSSLNLIAPMTRHLIEKIRAESKLGIEGGYLYMGQSYEQLGAGHWLMARLMWDANASTNGYYQTLYGKAAPQVQAYYDLLESRLITAKSSPLDTSSAAVRVALRKHPGLGSPAYILSAYHPVLAEATKLIAAAKSAELSSDETARLQRLIDQHELLLTTVRGMFVAARLESDASSSAEDAQALLALIDQRQNIRQRLKGYAPSLCASLDAGDAAETQALAPSGPLAQLARSLLSGTSIVRSFRPEHRWSAEGAATLTSEDGQLRVHIPDGSRGSITYTTNVKPSTSYRITHKHWNDPAPLQLTTTDDADATTRGQPPIAPRTRVIFRDAKTRNQWSGVGAHEHIKEWHTFPHFILTPADTKSISFTIFLHHPGTYLIKDVKLEELGRVK